MTTLYWSASTGGFYDSSIHGEAIPADKVEITASEHAALLDALSMGRVLIINSQGRPDAVEPPPPSMDVLAREVRRTRDRAIQAQRWLIERHNDELAAGRPTTLTPAEYLDVLTYVQALRDVPAQSGFAAEIAWPPLPAFLTTT